MSYLRVRSTHALLGLSLCALPLLFAGCTAAQQQNANAFFMDPIHVKCKGKGVTTIAAAGYSGTIQSDCGDGFEYTLERATK